MTGVRADLSAREARRSRSRRGLRGERDAIASGRWRTDAIERGADPPRVFGEKLGFGDVARVHLEFDAVVPGQDMEVQVEYRLARGATVELRDHHTLRVEGGLHTARNELRRSHQQRERARLNVKEVLCGCTRDHECVAVDLRHQIHERHAVRVFEDDVAGASPVVFSRRCYGRRRPCGSSTIRAAWT